MTNQNQTGKPSPRTLHDIEKLNSTNGGRWQFGLGRLIIVTNIVGLIVAIVVATQGMALAYAIMCGIIVGFLLPIIVAVGLFLVEWKELLVGRRSIPLASQTKKKEPPCPLDD